MKLSSPYTDEEETDEIRKALATGNISGTSPIVKEFEENLRSYVDVKNAIACSNCTTALHLACIAIGLGPQDEVIVASYSFPASGFAPNNKSNRRRA
jgi:dTDP-4-amino-4,6-dideoxygalactose transaminase